MAKKKTSARKSSGSKNKNVGVTEKIHGVISETGEIINLDNPIEAEKLNANTKKPTAITFKYQGEVATGVVIPSRHPASMQYLRDISDYNNENADVKAQIELSRKLYLWEGIVGTVIDMFCDFSTTDIKIENIKNQKGQDIVDYFLKEVNRGYNNITTGSVSLSHMMAYLYFIDGNVLMYNRWNKTKYGKKSSQSAKLPMLLVPINPMSVNIPQDSIDFGSKLIQIDLSSYYKNKTTREINEFGQNKSIPLRVRRAIQNREKSISLSDDEIYHIKRRGTTFGAWGIPYLTRAFSAIASKRRLRVLDDSTTDGMINSITIFKIGDPEVPATLNPSRVTKLQSLLANPTASLMLAWSYDIDVLHVGPSGDVLNFSDKYNQVNYDIMAALGVPISLLTGQGDKAGDIWVSMMIFMERLEECRHEIREYFRLIVNRILEENGIYNENPTVRTPSTKIRKEDVKNQILSLWDRGVLSYDTALEEAGFNFEAEYQKKKKEQSMKIEKVFVRPSLPFDSPNNKPAERKTVDEKEPKNSNPQNVDMKDPENKRIEGFMQKPVDDIRWLKSKFANLTREHGINYAVNWYIIKMKKLANTLGDYGYGIRSSTSLLSAASITGNKSVIFNAVNNLEDESLCAIYKFIQEAILADEKHVDDLS